MRYLISGAVILLLGVGIFAPLSWSNHAVGEPELEKLPIWQKCCAKEDCVPEQVRIMGKNSSGMISVEIDGVQTSVAKQKFSPVPSPRTWVCYDKPNGNINDDNIRCILHPQHSGTTKRY